MSIPLLLVSLDTPFSVTLAEAASTGSLWRVAEGSSEQLTLLDEGLIDAEGTPPADPTEVVCGGIHERTFTFQAHGAGTHRLRMERVRPWLRPDPEALTQDWDVTVR